MEEYRYLATSRTGFIQQVVSCYLRHGYYFFVQGRISEGKDADVLDRKLLVHYGIAKNRNQRYWRKKHGQANVQYIRFERDWLMLATQGKHDWFHQERANIRDCRRQPIRVLGYSLSVVNGGYVSHRLKEAPDGPPERDSKRRVRVQISRAGYRELHATLLENARRRRVDWFAQYFWNIGYEPYAPIRRQLLELIRQVNKSRSAAGLPKISPKVIRYQQRKVKPFEKARMVKTQEKSSVAVSKS